MAEEKGKLLKEVQLKNIDIIQKIEPGRIKFKYTKEIIKIYVFKTMEFKDHASILKQKSGLD